MGEAVFRIPHPFHGSLLLTKCHLYVNMDRRDRSISILLQYQMIAGWCWILVFKWILEVSDFQLIEWIEHTRDQRYF